MDVPGTEAVNPADYRAVSRDGAVKFLYLLICPCDVALYNGIRGSITAGAAGEVWTSEVASTVRSGGVSSPSELCRCSAYAHPA